MVLDPGTEPTGRAEDHAGLGRAATVPIDRSGAFSRWDARQQQKLSVRRAVLLVVGVSLILIAYAAWQEYRPHVLAVGYLKMIGGSVSWQIDANNWYRGGITTADLSAASYQLKRVDLRHLRMLHALESLDLTGCYQISDDGLIHLRGLSHLKSLILTRLGRTSFTQDLRLSDAAMIHLQGLTGLQELSLEGSDVSDTGLKSLSNMRKMVNLDLGATRVSDTGLRLLGGMKDLKTLNLHDTRITDAGLRELLAFARLEELDLGGTEITDRGILLLRGLPALKVLNVDKTRVTSEGLAGLMQTFPMLEVTSDLTLTDDAPRLNGDPGDAN